MKKYLKFFSFFIAVLLLGVGVTSCDSESQSEPPIPIVVQPSLEELIKDVKFESKTIQYDGKTHSLKIDNLPEEVSVEYYNNNKTDPGKYEVEAKLSYLKEEATLKATLEIQRLASVLKADKEQVVTSYSTKKPAVDLNNTEQEIRYIYKKDGKVVDEKNIKNGVYEVEIYAPQSKTYEESNHLVVTLTIKDSQFDISFDDAKMIADGKEKEITLTGTLPNGYHVSYENNKASTAGYYYAVANILDSSNEAVEKHYATLFIDNLDSASFETYLDEFFIEYLEGDQLTVNIFCENPADFGLSRYDALWYTYQRDLDSNSMENVKEFQAYLDELHAFDFASLSDRQKVAYNQLDNFFDYYKNYYGIENIDFKKNHYIDQFGGYVADFGTYMEAYSLRCKEDVEDIISYIHSTEEAFASYILYLEDKTQKGYGLSDFTLTSMLDYLDDILALKETNEAYYLADVLEAKIQALSFLTDKEKESYIQQIQLGLQNEFMNGVEKLYEGISKFVGLLSKDKEGYLGNYEDGKDIFVLELKNLLGLENFDEEAYIAELDSAIRETSIKSMASTMLLKSKYNAVSYAQLQNLLKSCAIFKGTPEEMISYLKEFAKTIVPDLKSAPNITIKEMDLASAKVSNAVAYYMKSALDNTTQEFITLNPVKIGDTNDVLGTLSHEGYPGHLYAYCYSKELNLHNISKIMTSTAHGEGWATYVELKLYEYAKSKSSNQKFKDVMDYLYNEQLSSFLLETRLDAGIHIQRWTVKQVADYLNGLGYNGEAAQDIYDLLIETPASYAAYGYGKLFFYKLHKEAEKILGSNYDEVEFNAMLLSKGWTSLGELKKTYETYMKQKCHKYQLEMN